ncbi:ribosome biogenesis protein Nop16 [Sordaria brevicollis]|uniref:Nucleolar protein 16 n=1 Tax=Sordaria brevicollis TaxID=83679 RepID=A0AAE0PMS6_SORBR|nr:ribosome biogenesis protein Nop16 [Sordaria brevicollis]
MGRELQKRKKRSSRAKVQTHTIKKKHLNPQGSGIVAKAWNKNETLSQNYSRFGLVAKLGTATGGMAKKSAAANYAGITKDDPLAVKSADRGLLEVREVKVERDASGKIVKVLRNDNPLNDPLNEIESDSETEKPHNPTHDIEWNGISDDRQEMIAQSKRPEVVRLLEEEASRPVEKTVRYQSERELEWLQRLVAKHGDDVAAMVRDMKLNPMQQTKADITKRLKKAGLLQ